MTRYHAAPGGADAGTALQAAMNSCVSDIRMPASLLDRAVSRHRQRKTRIRLASTAAVTATVAATAAVIVAVPGRPGHAAPARSGPSLHAQSAAYVLDRAATAQVNSYRMISVDQGDGLTYTDVATQQQRLVSALRDSSGQPYFQITTAISGDAYNQTYIEYQHRVYSTFTTSSLDDGSRVTLSSFLPLQGNPDPHVAFQQALKTGTITVVGHRRLNGRDTILISVKSASKPGDTVQWPPSWVWIDASTYLVVQTEHFVPDLQSLMHLGTPGSKVTWRAVFDHVTWLAPTPQNLALLTVTPPAGFTKIPFSEMGEKYLGPIS